MHHPRRLGRLILDRIWSLELSFEGAKVEGRFDYQRQRVLTNSRLSGLLLMLVSATVIDIRIATTTYAHFYFYLTTLIQVALV